MYMRQEFGASFVCIFLACYIALTQYFPVTVYVWSLMFELWGSAAVCSLLLLLSLFYTKPQPYFGPATEAKNQGDWWLLETGGMRKNTDILTFVPHSPRQVLLLVPHSECTEDAEEALLGHGIICMMMVFTSSLPVWSSDSLISVFLHHQHLGKEQV